MNGISPWQIAATTELFSNTLSVIFEKTIENYTFYVLQSASAIYIDCKWKNGRVTFRPVYSPDGNLTIKRKKINLNGCDLSLSSPTGNFKLNIEISKKDYPLLKYKTRFSPSSDLHIPFWPKDIIFSSSKNPDKISGTVHVKQVGTRTGVLYVSIDSPKAGAIMYFQDLTSLAAYNQETKTSAAETVGGIWPEIGFSLPPTKDSPLISKKEYIISDAIIAFDKNHYTQENDLADQYLNLLASVYLEITKPTTEYLNWPSILNNGLKDLIDSPGCWCQVDGNQYFNAYVSDYDTPPEIMVQLAILLPLVDYSEWSGEQLEVIKKIKQALPSFYDKKLKTIVRWLPKAQDKLKGEEEQKKPMVMDSWYLHHPLLNLSRLALKGDKTAKSLFLDSLGYAIKVARNFKYEWPVFYKMDTLEIVKAETKPGEGGQHDVAGLYAHIMLQAFELTNEQKYLKEAEKAAKTLQGKGFKLFYQANNTAFSAGALLRLYKLTKKEVYLQLSNLCWANIFQNMQLWDCNYGYGKNFPSFFALFPLSDAPYTAAYEEQEVFCAIHDYLKQANDVKILPSINLLVNEYVRYLVNRAAYYYPPMLPKNMLSDKVKIGEVDANLWVALEDMHDGWEKCGEVGQEVYGAGNAFGILPRHYIKITDNLLLYADYPIDNVRIGKDNHLTFKLLGDNRITCRLRLIASDKKLKSANIMNSKKVIDSLKTKEGHLEWYLKGSQSLKLIWQNR